MNRLPSPRTTPPIGHLWRWTFQPVDLLAEGARIAPVFQLSLWRRVVVGYRPDWNRAVLGDLETFRSRGSLSDLTPYLSAGVNEEGLADLDTYFASTLTYAQQAPLLMQQLQERGITEFGLVVTDTPSFDGFVAAVEAAADEAGITVGYQTRISKTAAEPEQLSVVQALKDSGAQAVVLNTSPVVFIGLANQGLNQGYTPTWMGPGVTSGLNAVTNFGCPAVETGVFLSPTPNLDVIDQLDPNFRTAYEQFAPADAPVDDIGLQLWALNKALGLMFEATGAELGRAAFMNTLVTSEGFDNGIYSPVQFTVDDHFGGTGAHVLDADCTSDPKQFKTVEQFVSAG